MENFTVKRICAFLLGIFLSNLGFATYISTDHPANLVGKVSDAASGENLAGARIRLLGHRDGAVTDENGEYQFIDLVAGPYRVVVTYLGYAADTLPVTITEDQTIFLNHRLRPAPTELAVVNIIGAENEAIDLIQPIDMRLRPVESAQDLLRLAPGLFIAQHAGGGKAEQIFLRGFDIDHGTDVAITVDGMPVNMVSHAHGQGYADLHFIIPETVERLDVNKGPYTASDGNLATAGAVHFQTRDRIQSNYLKLEAGQFGTMRGVGLIDLSGLGGNEKQNKGGYIAAEYMGTQGFFESPQDLRRTNLFAKYSFPLRSNTELALIGSAFQSDWNASGQVPLRAIESGQITRFGAIDDTEGGQTSRYNAQLQLNHRFEDGSNLSQQIYLTRYNFDLYSNFTFFLNDPVNGDQIWQTESRNLLGYTGNWRKRYFLGHKAATTRLGWGLREDQVQDIGLYRTLQRATILEPVDVGAVREQNAFAWIEQTLHLSPRLSATAALRYDAFAFRYDDQLDSLYAPQRVTKGIASPKLTLNYQVRENVRFYVQAGTGFHSNDTRVVVREPNRPVLPRALGADVGVALKPVPRMLLNAAVWGLDLEQEFVYVGDEGVVEPSGETRRYGFDLSLRYQLTDWLFLDADLNGSRPRALDVPEAEAFIPLGPTLTSTGGLSIQTPGGFSGSLRYRFLADRPANEDYSLTAEGYTLVDATASYRLTKKITFGTTASNVLNSEWKEAQFETTSRLRDETLPVTEIHFTPGNPFFIKSWVEVRF